jgi:hypothetical protein
MQLTPESAWFGPAKGTKQQVNGIDLMPNNGNVNVRFTVENATDVALEMTVRDTLAFASALVEAALWADRKHYEGPGLSPPENPRKRAAKRA